MVIASCRLKSLISFKYSKFSALCIFKFKILISSCHAFLCLYFFSLPNARLSWPTFGAKAGDPSSLPAANQNCDGIILKDEYQTVGNSPLCSSSPPLNPLNPIQRLMIFLSLDLPDNPLA